MGPLALCALIGLDVLHSVCDSLYEDFKEPVYAPPPLMKRMVAAGRLGRKTRRDSWTSRDQTRRCQASVEAALEQRSHS